MFKKYLLYFVQFAMADEYTKKEELLVTEKLVKLLTKFGYDKKPIDAEQANKIATLINLVIRDEMSKGQDDAQYVWEVATKAVDILLRDGKIEFTQTIVL